MLHSGLDSWRGLVIVVGTCSGWSADLARRGRRHAGGRGGAADPVHPTPTPAVVGIYTAVLVLITVGGEGAQATVYGTFVPATLASAVYGGFLALVWTHSYCALPGGRKRTSRPPSAGEKRMRRGHSRMSRWPLWYGSAPIRLTAIRSRTGRVPWWVRGTSTVGRFGGRVAARPT